MTTSTFAPSSPANPEPDNEEKKIKPAIEAEVVEETPEPPTSEPPIEAPPCRAETAPTVDDEAEPPDDAQEPNESFNLPAPTDFDNTSGYQGEYDEQSFQLNRINLAQKIGPLGEVFEPGSLVFNFDADSGEGVMIMDYDRKTKTWSPGELEVTIILAEKSYKEDVPYGEGIEPQIFQAKQDVIDAGGGFVKGHKNRYFPQIRVLMLVKAPDQETFDKDIFSERYNDEAFAMCSMYLRKTAFYESGVKIEQLSKRVDVNEKPIHLSRHALTLSIITKTMKENKVFVPKFSVVGSSDEVHIKQIQASL